MCQRLRDRMMISSCEQDPQSSCSSVGQPADEDTLIEVLVADDDDGNILNGTPNEEAICAAFAARGIFSGDFAVCEESAGGGCSADLNFDGALDFLDFLEFQNLFAARDPRADFTGEGALDFFDFLAFENEFAIGCP